VLSRAGGRLIADQVHHRVPRGNEGRFPALRIDREEWPAPWGPGVVAAVQKFRGRSLPIASGISPSRIGVSRPLLCPGREAPPQGRDLRTAAARTSGGANGGRVDEAHPPSLKIYFAT